MTLVEPGGAKVGWPLKAVENVRKCKQAEERYEMPRLNIFLKWLYVLSAAQQLILSIDF
jgi:hypothetical protein